jgi:hypothetical protein
MSNVASSSLAHHAASSLAARAHRRNRFVIPDAQLWRPVSRTVIALPHTTTLAVTRPRTSNLRSIHIFSQARLRKQREFPAIMSFRPGSRIFSSFRPFFRQAQADARRRASTAAGPGGFAGFWNSPIGPKTVHFWYVCSVAMSIAGICDAPASSITRLTPRYIKTLC